MSNLINFKIRCVCLKSFWFNTIVVNCKHLLNYYSKSIKRKINVLYLHKCQKCWIFSKNSWIYMVKTKCDLMAQLKLTKGSSASINSTKMKISWHLSRQPGVAGSVWILHLQVMLSFKTLTGILPWINRRKIDAIVLAS